MVVLPPLEKWNFFADDFDRRLDRTGPPPTPMYDWIGLCLVFPELGQLGKHPTDDYLCNRRCTRTKGNRNFKAFQGYAHVVFPHLLVSSDALPHIVSFVLSEDTQMVVCHCVTDVVKCRSFSRGHRSFVSILLPNIAL